MPFLSKLFFLVLLFLFFSCESDSSAELQISSNQLAWKQNESTYFSNKVQASIVFENGNKKLYLSAALESNSEGVLVQLNTNNEDLIGRYPLADNASVMLNDKREGNLAVFLSKGCKPNKGFIEITDFDEKASTISGRFEAEVCAQGKFILHGNSTVHDGIFKDVKFFATKK